MLLSIPQCTGQPRPSRKAPPERQHGPRLRNPAWSEHHHLSLHIYLCGHLCNVSPAGDSNLPGSPDDVCLVHPGSQALAQALRKHRESKCVS